MNSKIRKNSVREAILDALGGDGQWVAAANLEAVATALGITRRTVGRYLADLVGEGRVAQRGAGPAVEYRLDPVATWFNTPPHERPVVTYDPARLAGYVPNQTQWLSAAQRERMRTAQPEKSQAGSYPLAVAEKLMVDLSWASSRLEGNTYNYLDTEALVRYGQVAQGKDATETAMILNHKKAISHLVDVAQTHDAIVPRTIREFHALLSEDLMDPREAGALRRRKVSIGGSSYQPLAVPSRLEEEFTSLVEKAGKIEDPFEQSLFWMIQVAYLQPFVDINKRTGRLACNIPLLRSGLAPLSFMDMDKARYIRGLLEFYELGATATIAAAFEQAYIQSAHRYEAHVSLDPAQASLDRLYKQELGNIVKSYVACVANDDPDTWEDIMDSCLVHIQDPGIAQGIGQRAVQLLEGLNEANRILYAISLHQYQDYLQASGLRGQPAGRMPRP